MILMYRCEICGFKINQLQIKPCGTIECEECGVDHELVNNKLIALHLGPSEE